MADTILHPEDPENAGYVYLSTAGRGLLRRIAGRKGESSGLVLIAKQHYRAQGKHHHHCVGGIRRPRKEEDCMNPDYFLSSLRRRS